MIFPVDWEIFALFCLTEFAFSVSPGPAVFLVVAHAARGGMRPAAACAVWRFVRQSRVFRAFGDGGRGVARGFARMVFLSSNGAARRICFISRRALSPFAAARKIRPRREGVAFRESFLMQLANPKTILFFVAFLPLFVDAQKPVIAQMLVFAGASFLIELAVLCGYALATRRITARFGDSVARASWVLLCCAAAALLFV